MVAAAAAAGVAQTRAGLTIDAAPGAKSKEEEEEIRATKVAGADAGADAGAMAGADAGAGAGAEAEADAVETQQLEESAAAAGGRVQTNNKVLSYVSQCPVFGSDMSTWSPPPAMTPLTRPAGQPTAATAAAASTTPSDKVPLVDIVERSDTVASARSPLPSNNSPVPPPYASPSAEEQHQTKEAPAEKSPLGSNNEGVAKPLAPPVMVSTHLPTVAAAAVITTTTPAAAPSLHPRPARSLPPPPPAIDSTLLDALEETRLNLEIAVIERRHTDIQHARKAHALQHKAQKAQKTIASLRKEVATEKRLNAELAAKEAQTVGEEATYLPAMSPINLKRGDRVGAWNETATRKQLKELCRRHAKQRIGCAGAQN